MRLRTKWLGDKGRGVRRYERTAMVTATLEPRVIVGQVAVIASDGAERRYITLRLEQEGVSVEARLLDPGELLRELGEACEWLAEPRP